MHITPHLLFRTAGLRLVEEKSPNETTEIAASVGTRRRAPVGGISVGIIVAGEHKTRTAGKLWFSIVYRAQIIRFVNSGFVI